MNVVPTVRLAAPPSSRSVVAESNPAVPADPQPEIAAGQTVHLDIGHMVLPNMSFHDQRQIRRALEHEFTRLVDGSPDFDWHAVSSLDRINASDYPAGASAEQIGRHLASEIFRGLGH
jgi:hypothetical protein